MGEGSGSQNAPRCAFESFDLVVVPGDLLMQPGLDFSGRLVVVRGVSNQDYCDIV